MSHLESQMFSFYWLVILTAFPGASDGKESAYNAGDPSPIPGSERFPGEGQQCKLGVLLGRRFSIGCASNSGEQLIFLV